MNDHHGWGLTFSTMMCFISRGRVVQRQDARTEAILMQSTLRSRIANHVCGLVHIK